MISAVLSIVLFLIFIMLAMIHFNWAFGGKWGFEEALPTKETGERILNPTALESAIVGIGLMMFGFFYLIKSGMLDVPVPMWITKYAGWVILGIFALRAIGDFKYIGFFKKIKQTEFGKMDSRLYTPLCLTIGFIGMLIQIIN